MNVSKRGSADQRAYSKSIDWRKIAIVVIILGVIAAGVLFRDKLSIDRLAEQEEALRAYLVSYPIRVLGVAFVAYVVITGLSLPGAVFMTLVIGWYFGFMRGVIMVSFASTAGATLSFLLSRYLLRDTIQSKFGHWLKTFNEAFDREGAFYLFTLRLIPAVPFWAINLVMGLTRIRVITFWWVSQLGMLAGTGVYVYAGSTIPNLAQLADPAKLRVEDVFFWPQFISALESREDGNHNPNPALTRIYEHLSVGARTLVTEYNNTDDNSQIHMDLVKELNHVLEIPNLIDETVIRQLASRVPTNERQHTKEQWRSKIDELESSRPRNDDKQRVREQWKKKVTNLNRAAMVAVLPDFIRPPQPILSWHLFAAFIALGIFPILVKKLMERAKASRGADIRRGSDT